MKIRVMLLAAGSIFIGAVVALVLVKQTMPTQMIHEMQSPLGYDQTIEMIIDNAKAREWGVPKIHDYQKALSKNGYQDIGRVKTVELCHPKYASELLSNDDNKYVAVMMPCAIAVYEKGSGETYVASMNMKLMSMIWGGEIGEAMDRVALEDEKILGFLKQL